MDADARVALAEIRGDVKLILAGQDRTNNDVRDLRAAQLLHANRIGVLEASKLLSDGERKGVAGTVKVLWAFGGVVITAIIAALLRHFGA